MKTVNLVHANEILERFVDTVELFDAHGSQTNERMFHAPAGQARAFSIQPALEWRFPAGSFAVETLKTAENS